MFSKLDKTIVLYGAGKLCKQFLALCHLWGINPVYIIDQNPALWGDYIISDYGQTRIKIISPKEGKSLGEIHVIITPVGVYSAITSMREYGFENYYFVPAFLLKDLRGLNWGEINTVASRLSDDRSREVLFKSLQYWFNADIHLIEDICEPNQYFPEDIVTFSEREIFVDGGAYNGDTSLEFIRRVDGKFVNIHIFEPFPKMGEIITDKLRPYIHSGKAKLIGKALSNQNGTVNFEENGMASRIINSGKGKAITETLDNYFANSGAWPTFIKLDVEGLELDVLKGASECIIKAHPKLAICIYHRLEDFYEIPLFLMENYPFYRFYVRHHSMYHGETVIYAIPMEPKS